MTNSEEADLSLNGQVKKFSFLKRKSKPVLSISYYSPVLQRYLPNR